MIASQNSPYSVNGFTLIELVVVIIIVAILTVIAVPKFINLSSDAHLATMKGVAAAMQSAKTLVYSACVISRDCDQTAPIATGNGLGNSLEAQGEKITLAFGYPRHSEAGIARAINIKDNANGGEFNITTFSSGGQVAGLRIRPNADYAANKCEVRYSQPQAAGAAPIIVVEVNGC
ncbi:prepilin-type N-terminal cleavage/methylation domain-containing protein [Shewanella sp. OMA3-2]|uniref:prepilin-type N-terminal cleavage/methylation domain-containing protein n=1 Tax=Shewanella sp. OMA3-2 TaxID=2908650 RepID=UPI001F33D5E5|nr:prepilin-type N-terminal cleavage/methylation domain-containing protein [Shewanella sp. OMA3-2]UJF22481.1 prepilin-type N-terminal cleavage/methylation domain-containing protein [Shewanella sp. OMA3-2]